MQVNKLQFENSVFVGCLINYNAFHNMNCFSFLVERSKLSRFYDILRIILRTLNGRYYAIFVLNFSKSSVMYDLRIS